MTGRRAVVIGAGAVAIRKAESLSACGARVVIVSEHADKILTDFSLKANAELIESRYSKNYLAGAVLAIAATNDTQVNEQIYHDCQELEVLCNVVDKPELCDFFVPAVVSRGDLQIAIGTEGHSPAYAGHLRKKLEQIFTEKHGEFLAELEKMRSLVIERLSNVSDRKAVLGSLAGDDSFEYFEKNSLEEWRRHAEETIKRYE
ncbi:MAG: bifunctional precorrin-2 dehydrogenase/sirohydrochlorin ferrochelatase [Sedimentisphaerales bacterium]|nr:bifunctional precorrin-2 dehydrogenase/sirohydrochlorin ferrochelatase [Sedimentisphaerales bacterium]